MKKKLIALLLTLTLFIPTSSVKAYFDGDNSGINIGAGDCNSATTGWCMWKNGSFTISKVSLIFYRQDGAAETIGGPVIFYNGASDKDLQEVCESLGLCNRHPAGYWPTSASSYGNLDTIVENDGNLHDILDTVAGGAGGYEGIKEKVKNNDPAETFGLGGAQGYRLIVEPIFKIKSNSRYSGGAGWIKLNTLRGFLGSGENTIDSLLAFGQKLFVDVDDVYKAVDCGSWSVYGGVNDSYGSNGCGIGVYAPFNAPEPIEKGCDPFVEPDNCNGGKVADPKFSCLFEKNLRSYYANTDAKNPYCQVVCRDVVNYTYTGGRKTVLQGGFMTIGDNPLESIGTGVSLNTVTLMNSRICRSTGIEGRVWGVMDTDLFLNGNKTILGIGDLAKKVKKEYNNVIKVKTFKDKVYGASVVGGLSDGQDGSSVIVCSESKECTTSYEQAARECPSSFKMWGYKSVNDCIDDRVESSCTKSYSCSISWNGLSIGKDYSEGEYSESKASTDFKEEALKMLKNAISSYNTAANAYGQAIDYWNACETGSILNDNQIVNDLKGGNITLDYANVDKNGNVVYSYDGASLKGSSINKGSTKLLQYPVGTSANEEKDVPEGNIGYDPSTTSIGEYGKFDTTTGAFTQTTKTYGTNVAWWQKMLDYDISYTLPTNGYRYKTIPEGLYTKDWPGGNNFVNFGYSVMPVSMTTPRGKVYNYYLQIKSLGKLDKKFQHLYSETNATCEYKIDCERYIVDPRNCESVPDECKAVVPCGDMTIIYRTISLNKGEAFPGIAAKGRDPGKNWQGNDHEDGKMTKVDKYIYNNRGATGYNVYTLKPMYEIDLTPSRIRLLRTYNRQANRARGLSLNKNNSGIGLYGYSDFKSMLCSNTSSPNYTCTSALLRGENKYNSVDMSALAVGGCAIRGKESATTTGNSCFGSTASKDWINNKSWAMNAAKEYSDWGN